MQLISEYQLLASDDRRSLQSKVNTAIDEGWVPSGTALNFGGELVQAMVKFRDNR